uniref:C-type lectin domain-containing protein n=1 Tax=Erpetoichthys calabaricus TaxID=27687 RepID=A0A8C4THR4_ERPCA
KTWQGILYHCKTESILNKTLLRNVNYILTSNNSALQSKYATLNEKLHEVSKEFSDLKEFYCDVTTTSPGECFAAGLVDCGLLAHLIPHFFICSFVSFSTDNTCSVCKPGWVPISSKCYFISIYKLTWKESRDWCKTSGGRLLNIESSDVQVCHLRSSNPGKFSAWFCKLAAPSIKAVLLFQCGFPFFFRCMSLTQLYHIH